MKALIIEDNAAQAKTTRLYLTKCGYDCDVAADGNTGCRMLCEQTYDIALVDIRLPGMDGLEIVRRAKEREVETPIIILSVQGSPASKTLGLDLGADDYLAKPFSLDELRARIDVIFRLKSKASAAAPMQCDTLVLNPVSMKVCRGSRMVHLSKIEFGLLEFLMRRKGVLVSKKTILDELWDYAGATSYHVVEMAVSSLRKKINWEGENPLIQTVRGLGYVIE